MRRNATLSLDDLDPEVLDAARDVARRAGVPLESWIESVVGGEAKAARTSLPQQPVEPAVERRRRKRTSDAAPAAAEAKPSYESRASRAETAPRDLSETIGNSIGAMARRLDELDRSLAENRKQSEGAAASAIAKLEGRIAEALDQAPAGALAGKLDEIERRMNDLSGQLSGPRPLGRRGRPLVAEMRDAVEQVRQRQRELDAAGDEPVQPSNAPSPAISDLQRETSKLRESLGSLATGRDVGALEQAMRTLAADVHRAREPGDLAAIAAPVELIRVQVDRLAEEVAENVHARISGEVARLAHKVDGSLSATVSYADRDALAGVHQELDEIRRQIGALAGPERIQGLAQGLQSISAQISQLQGAANAGPSVDSLKPLLEEIRKGIAAPDRSSRALLGRLDALADKLDRVGATPVGDILGRLEDLSSRMQHPSAGQGDLAAIQKMLRSLADKVDHVQVGSGAESLDALEKQVVGIARRLDAQRADPALAGLERMMADLLGQVTALCGGEGVEAAVERATRRAVAETADRGGTGFASAGVDQLRSDLAEIAARQAAADQRMQATMGNLNTMLERLVDRLGPPMGGEGLAYRAAPRDQDESSLSERLMASTMPVGHSPIAQAPLPPMSPEAAPRTRQQRRPDAPRVSGADSAHMTDELLEPGSARPRPSASSAAEAREPVQSGADIKANFIAAARRAAQAAQADIGAPSAPERRSERARPGTTASAAPAAAGGLVARLRSEIDSRRRPLLLGLAAIVLVLGAFQAFTMTTGDTTSDPAKIAAAPPTEQTPRVAHEPATEAPATESLAAKADPATTQSLADPSPAPSAPARATATAKSSVPKIAGMEALKPELASVPIALASLKQAALDGDGAAIYDLASREADGRGVTRDLGVAAKLYEKLAIAGFAPAQFKLGSAYEKGSGLVRDLDQAKLWYGRAAEQGNSRAMHNLAVVHAENPAVGGKPDFATAASWFRRAAEYGVRDSQYNLAVLYARGLGMNQDLVQSYAWFAAAAAQGDEEAGKKRDDVAAKLAPKDLTTAKGIAAAFKPKPTDPSANDSPAVKPTAPAAMSLLGAPPPGSPTSNGFTPSRSSSQSGV